MAVPLLEKLPSKRRHRVGDFFAVLLLLAIVVGLGWLWWHEKHPAKISKPKPAEKTSVQPPARPKLKPLVIAPQ